jgi:hypothetical protein
MAVFGSDRQHAKADMVGQIARAGKVGVSSDQVQTKLVPTGANANVVIQYANSPGGKLRMIPGNVVPG